MVSLRSFWKVFCSLMRGRTKEWAVPSFCSECSYLKERWLVLRVPSWDHQETSHNTLTMYEQERKRKKNIWCVRSCWQFRAPFSKQVSQNKFIVGFLHCECLKALMKAPSQPHASVCSLLCLCCVCSRAPEMWSCACHHFCDPKLLLDRFKVVL